MTNLLSKRNLVIGISVFIALILCFIFFYENDNYAAKVDGHKISYDELDQRTSSTIKFYITSNDTYDENLIRTDSLDQLISKTIVENYASENELSVSQEDLNNYYDQRVAEADSEEELLSEINRLWGLDKDQYLASLEYDLLRNIVQNSLDMDLAVWLDQQYTELDIVKNIE